MKTIRSTFLVESDEAVSIAMASKLLGRSIRYLQRQDTRNRLGLQLVRNRINLDDRKIWLSRESVIKAAAGLRRDDE